MQLYVYALALELQERARQQAADQRMARHLDDDLLRARRRATRPR